MESEATVLNKYTETHLELCSNSQHQLSGQCFCISYVQ